MSKIEEYRETVEKQNEEYEIGLNEDKRKTFLNSCDKYGILKDFILYGNVKLFGTFFSEKKIVKESKDIRFQHLFRVDEEKIKNIQDILEYDGFFFLLPEKKNELKQNCFITYFNNGPVYISQFYLNLTNTNNIINNRLKYFLNKTSGQGDDDNKAEKIEKYKLVYNFNKLHFVVNFLNNILKKDKKLNNDIEMEKNDVYNKTSVKEIKMIEYEDFLKKKDDMHISLTEKFILFCVYNSINCYIETKNDKYKKIVEDVVFYFNCHCVEKEIDLQYFCDMWTDSCELTYNSNMISLIFLNDCYYIETNLKIYEISKYILINKFYIITENKSIQTNPTQNIYINSKIFVTDKYKLIAPYFNIFKDIDLTDVFYYVFVKLLCCSTDIFLDKNFFIITQSNVNFINIFKILEINNHNNHNVVNKAEHFSIFYKISKNFDFEKLRFLKSNGSNCCKSNKNNLLTASDITIPLLNRIDNYFIKSLIESFFKDKNFKFNKYKKNLFNFGNFSIGYIGNLTEFDNDFNHYQNFDDVLENKNIVFEIEFKLKFFVIDESNNSIKLNDNHKKYLCNLAEIVNALINNEVIDNFYIDNYFKIVMIKSFLELTRIKKYYVENNNFLDTSIYWPNVNIYQDIYEYCISNDPEPIKWEKELKKNINVDFNPFITYKKIDNNKLFIENDPRIITVVMNFTCKDNFLNIHSFLNLINKWFFIIFFEYDIYKKYIKQNNPIKNLSVKEAQNLFKLDESEITLIDVVRDKYLKKIEDITQTEKIKKLTDVELINKAYITLYNNYENDFNNLMTI